MGIITFNGKSSSDYGVVVERYPDYDFPEEDYESVHVPGKNGDIQIRKGSYSNVTGKYDLASGDGSTNFYTLAERVSNWLHSAKGYARLEDSYNPNIYRMALFKKSGTITNIENLGGRITVEFDCKPQKFLKSGETPTTFSAQGTITNPTGFDSKPLLKVNGKGNGSININGKVINIKCLRITVNDNSGLDSVEVNIDTFINAIGQSASSQFEFECSDFNLTTTVEATGITAATTNKATFVAKVGLNQEATYEFLFVAANASIGTNVTSTTLSDLSVRDQTTFLQTFSNEGIYNFVYSSDEAVATVSGTGITAASVNATTYKQRFEAVYTIANAYVDKTYIYSSNGYWMDGENSIELSDYGITVTGTPVANDTITARLKAKWTNNLNTYSDIFTFSGYPGSGDTVPAIVVGDHWVYRKDSIVVIDTGLVLAEYGITPTGTPVNGDTIKVKADGSWELNSSTVSLSTYGITPSGKAKENDTITVIINEPITIDCELEDAYTSTINRNGDIILQGGFPTLSPGSNNVSFTGGITSVEVTPRWWTL